MTDGKKKYTVRHRLGVDYIYDAVEAESEMKAVELVHKMVKRPFFNLHEWENFKKLKSTSELADLGWTAEEAKK